MPTTMSPGAAGIRAADDETLLEHIDARRARAVAAVRHRPWRIGPWTVAADLAAVALAGGLVHLLGTPLPMVTLGVLALLWPALLVASGGYADHLHRGAGNRVRTVVQAGTALGVACWLLPVLTETSVADRTLALLILALALTCLTTRLVVDRQATHGRTGRRVVIAGTGPEVRRIAEELGRSRTTFEVVAVNVPFLEPGETFEVPVEVGLDSLAATASMSAADLVIVAGGGHYGAAELRRLGWELESSGVELHVSSGMLDASRARTSVAHLGGLRTLHVRQVPRSGGSRALKGVLERSVAALALLALSPLLLTIAAGIRLTSPGPAIYRQKRVGHHGREFTMLKFRTMRKDADRARDVLDGRNECDAVLFKMRQDPRVTPFGKRLREYSLDEVPQLINVVLGHMSLVGPRPALPAEVAEYDHDPRHRLTVKPGLTGLWQVSGRSDLAWDEAVRLDLLYVDNWSLGLDLAIVARTFGAVLGHRGAY